MFKTLILCGLALPAPAAELDKAVLYQAPVAPNTRLPIYENGYMIVTYSAGDSAITVYGSDGLRLFDTLVHVPQADSLSLGNSAADIDGTIAVTIAYSTSGKYVGGIALLDRSGRQTRLIKTDRYMPEELAFDANHNLWTAGWQRDIERDDMPDKRDYLIFRKFSPEGEQVGAFVSRSSFPAGLEPGTGIGGLKSLRAVNNRVGALLMSGKVGNLAEWLELDLEGKLLGRWRMDDLHVANLALTPDGNLYAHTPCSHSQTLQLTLFDRTTASWRTLPGDLKAGCIMMGADGGDLVFLDYSGASALLQYFRPPKP
jgi:hypothetical protein